MFPQSVCAKARVVVSIVLCVRKDDTRVIIQPEHGVAQRRLQQLCDRAATEKAAASLCRGIVFPQSDMKTYEKTECSREEWHMCSQRTTRRSFYAEVVMMYHVFPNKRLLMFSFAVQSIGHSVTTKP